MSMRQSSVLNKAQTHAFQLPRIAKNKSRYQSYRTSRRVQNKSTYLEKVKNETHQQQEYGYLDTSKISAEQMNLKGMLRKFNEQTYNILGKYIENPVDKDKKQKTSSHSVVEVRQKQLQNSKTMLQQCRHQLQKLQSKSENLKFMNVEGFQKKIIQLKDQKEETFQVIKEIKKRNLLRGQEIKKDDEKDYNDIPELQNEVNIVNLKKQRLEEDTKYVNEQLNSLKEKNEKGDEKIKELLPEYERCKKEQEKEKESKKNRDIVEEKKKTLKNKKQSASTNKYQYTYLKLLKQLQETTKKCKQYDETTTDTNTKILYSKKELIMCEQKYENLKKTMPIPPKVKTPEKRRKTPKNRSQLSRSKSKSKQKIPPKKEVETESKGVFASLFNL